MARSFEADRAEVEDIPIPELEQDWLEARRPWWNASLAACLIPDDESRTGCEHPYVSLGDAVTEKLRPGEDVVDEDRQKLYRRGLAMEPYIAGIVQELTDYGRLVRPQIMIRRGPLLATPDYLSDDRDDVGIEIKSTRKRLTPVVPRYWWWQAQAQMWCFDWERVAIGALDSTLEVTLFEIPRDDDAILRIVREADRMLEALAWGDVPPGVALSSQNVGALWPKDDGEAAELPPEAAKLAAEYLEARDAVKAWEDVKKARRDRLAQMIGPRALGAVGGVQVASFRAAKDTEVFDAKGFLAKHRDLVPEEFLSMKPGSRRFLPNEKGLDALRSLTGDDDADTEW